MKIENTTVTGSTAISADKSKSIISSNEPAEKIKKNINSNNASSQMQLFGLARQFVIDGALLPADEQVPIEERANKRERINYLRQQQNIESIIQKAIQYCSDSEVTDRADQDWFSRFIKLAEDVSNKTMQELWAKILAGEITAPGSFSLKSLKTFRSLSINEAKLLSKACSLAVQDHGNKSLRIISGAYQTPGIFNFFSKDREHKIKLSSFGLSYAELMTLADNHLVFIQETELSPMRKGEAVNFHYNGLNLNFVATKNNCVLSFYKFTPIGSELAQLISDNTNDQFIASLKQSLQGTFKVKEQ